MTSKSNKKEGVRDRLAGFFSSSDNKSKSKSKKSSPRSSAANPNQQLPPPTLPQPRADCRFGTPPRRSSRNAPFQPAAQNTAHREDIGLGIYYPANPANPAQRHIARLRDENNVSPVSASNIRRPVSPMGSPWGSNFQPSARPATASLGRHQSVRHEQPRRPSTGGHGLSRSNAVRRRTTDQPPPRPPGLQHAPHRSNTVLPTNDRRRRR